MFSFTHNHLHLFDEICHAQMKPCLILLVTLICLHGCAAPSSQILEIKQDQQPVVADIFDLHQTPQNVLILENQLLAYLNSGAHESALTLGLNHLDPQFLGEVNLRLIIQAARLKKDFALTRALIRLGRLVYPNNPAFDIEDRLLKLAEGKCSLATQPIKNQSLSDTQKQIFGQIKALCPIGWTENIKISTWVGKPLQKVAQIDHIIPLPNSLIDQTCMVFAVGCGPVFLDQTEQEKTRLYGQAIWSFQNRRQDKLLEQVKLLLQRSQVIGGTGAENRAFAEYAWQIDRQNLSLSPTILVGVQTQDAHHATRQNQTVGAVGLATEMRTASNIFLTSAARYSVNEQAAGEIRYRIEETGLRFVPHERFSLSYTSRQQARLPPNRDIHGASTLLSETILSRLTISDRVQLTMSQDQGKEQFERTLYYLTSPHKIEEHKLTMRMDMSIKTDMTIWFETESITSRSADPVYNFEDTRLAIGLSMHF